MTRYRRKEKKKKGLTIYLLIVLLNRRPYTPFYRILISPAFRILMDWGLLATAAGKGFELYGILGFL